MLCDKKKKKNLTKKAIISLGARPGAGSDPASSQAPGGLSSTFSSFLTSSWAAVPWARPFRSKGRAQLDAAGCRLVGLLGEPGKRLLLPS